MAAPGSAQPEPHGSLVTCTNPASGATWRIDVDFSRSTVDGNPASISASEIAWRDPKDSWSYTLDRKSGKLTAVVASSMGGNIWYDTCRLP